MFNSPPGSSAKDNMRPALPSSLCLTVGVSTGSKSQYYYNGTRVFKSISPEPKIKKPRSFYTELKESAFQTDNKSLIEALNLCLIC